MCCPPTISNEAMSQKLQNLGKSFTKKGILYDRNA